MSQKFEIPNILWVAIISLGLFGIFHIVVGLTNPIQIVAAAINFILIFGIIRLSKWAYVLSLIVSIIGPTVLMIQGTPFSLLVLIVNATVFIPVILCTKDFFRVHQHI